MRSVSYHLPDSSHLISWLHSGSIISVVPCDLWLRPSWQMSAVQDPRKTWLATGNLLAGCCLWGRDFLSPSYSGCHPPALCLRQGEGPVRNRLALLWCSLNSLFCERARLCLIAFHEKVLSLSLFFFLSLAIPQFGLLSHLSSLRLSSGHSGPALTLSMQPAPPCSAPARSCWQTRASGLLFPWVLRLDT